MTRKKSRGKGIQKQAPTQENQKSPPVPTNPSAKASPSPIKWEQTGVFFDPESLGEQVHDRDTLKSRYEVFNRKSDTVRFERNWKLPALDRYLCPVDNGLVRGGVIRFPSRSEPYGDHATLWSKVRDHLAQFVALPSEAIGISVAYIFYTWLYDRFRTAPYLRLIGDLGSGKSRALRVIGDACYHPISASAGASMAALFRTMDRLGLSTVIVDECDLDARRDDHPDLMRMLRVGFQEGGKVLRCDSSQAEYEPRSYDVYGPKVIASRTNFPDAALESRCIRIYMGPGQGLGNIPTELPDSYEAEVDELQNKLLRWRFEHYFTPLRAVERIEMEPRLFQLYLPLATVIEDEESRVRLADYFGHMQEDLLEDRRQSPEGRVLAALLQRYKMSPAGQDGRMKIYVQVIVDLASDDERMENKRVSSICRGFHLEEGRDKHGVYFWFSPALVEKQLRLYGIES